MWPTGYSTVWCLAVSAATVQHCSSCQSSHLSDRTWFSAWLWSAYSTADLTWGVVPNRVFAVCSSGRTWLQGEQLCQTQRGLYVLCHVQKAAEGKAEVVPEGLKGRKNNSCHALVMLEWFLPSKSTRVFLFSLQTAEREPTRPLPINRNMIPSDIFLSRPYL